MCQVVSQLQAELADLVKMMDERGIVLAHTTIVRWVQRYVPEFEKRSQTLFSESNEEPPDTTRHHPLRLRGFASRHQRTEISGSDAAARSNTIQQVLE